MHIKRYLTLFCLLITTAVIPVAWANTKVLDLHHWTTTNGAQVYFVPAKQLPIIDIRVAFAAGSARDAKHPGLASITNNMLNQGAGQLSADDIANRFESAGAEFGNEVARDMAMLSLRSLSDSKYFNPALNTFITVLTQPIFPKTALKRTINSHLAAIAAQQQSPSNIASNAFYKALYHQTPYGHPIIGTKQSIAALSQTNLKDFFKNYYVAENATIALVGNISMQQAESIANNIAQKLKTGEPAPRLPLAPLAPQSTNETIKFPSSQTNIRIGQVAINRHTPDYFPLMVGNHILGGAPLISRLNDQVREKRGLSYSVYSTFIPMANKGPFVISLGTRNDQATEALQVTRNTLNQFITQGPTPEELIAAKKNITGSFPLRFTSNEAIANALVMLGFYQLPLDYFDTYIDKVNAVSIESIRSTFRHHLHPSKMVTITVGNNRS